MYLGRIVEYTDKRTLFTAAAASLHRGAAGGRAGAGPGDQAQKRVLQGDVPSPINPPPGCHFHTRCPYAEARCKVEVPLLREVAPGHHVACHLRDGAWPSSRALARI